MSCSKQVELLLNCFINALTNTIVRFKNKYAYLKYSLCLCKKIILNICSLNHDYLMPFRIVFEENIKSVILWTTLKYRNWMQLYWLFDWNLKSLFGECISISTLNSIESSEFHINKAWMISLYIEAFSYINIVLVSGLEKHLLIMRHLNILNTFSKGLSIIELN